MGQEEESMTSESIEGCSSWLPEHQQHVVYSLAHADDLIEHTGRILHNRRRAHPPRPHRRGGAALFAADHKRSQRATTVLKVVLGAALGSGGLVTLLIRLHQAALL